jgi:hypothetical protein
MQDDPRPRSRDGKFKLRLSISVAAVVGVVAICGYMEVGKRRALVYADRVVLSASYQRWVEAGRPAAGALQEFMKGRRVDLVVSNLLLTANGMNYMTQFALTNSMAGSEGTLFVTTNGVLIWMNSTRRASIVSSN